MNLPNESEREPPIPPGLRSLSSALRNFVDLFEIDKHLLAVAAIASGEQSELSESNLRHAISHLSRDECEEYLLRLAQGEPHLSIALSARLHPPQPSAQSQWTTRRTVKQLLAEAERERDEEMRQRAREAEQKRIQELDALARREGEAWQEKDQLVQKPSAKTYDQAVQLLSQLREVAARQKQEDIFQRRLNGIYKRYKTRHSLIEKLRAAGLHST
jgi:hypothetical protein